MTVSRLFERLSTALLCEDVILHDLASKLAKMEPFIHRVAPRIHRLRIYCMHKRTAAGSMADEASDEDDL